MIKITIIAGARPNFIKIAPIIHSIERHKANGSFGFVQDNNLACGGGTQSEQTAAIMLAFEKELIGNPADLVMVVGDVTSTIACSIVAKKIIGLYGN